jgi:hypothetical protein
MKPIGRYVKNQYIFFGDSFATNFFETKAFHNSMGANYFLGGQ